MSESENDDVFYIETNIFDEEEIYPDCTVQILRNSITGEISIGWWPNDHNLYGSEEPIDPI